MNHQVIDNYFPTDFFKNLTSNVFNSDFPWCFSPKVNNDQEDNSGYFVHKIYEDNAPKSPLWDEMRYMLSRLKATAILRAKVNFYLKTPEIVEHSRHIDLEIPHKGAILYLNTCDGYTRLADGTKVESVENRILLFDSSQLHNSTSTTNALGRLNININYI